MTSSASRAGIAYQLLRAEITGCTLLPGEVLSAQSIADRLEMSRTPVHEALKALSGEGLVRVVPRVGYIVTPVVASDIDDVFALRLELEVFGAGLAAERITNEEVSALSDQRKRARALDHDARDADRPQSLMASNREFHVQVAAASGNRWLPQLVGELLDAGERIYFLYFVPGGEPPASNPHDEILRALGSREPEAARRAMAAHVSEHWSGARRGAGLP